ncbi:cytochrome c peroxidase [Pedobacter sp. Du54]|uniref:cytochrome-c peroxidase n=1 Tax=Pedobacter anseongensis TaxID=3133439 RepID=UPI00309B33E7
MRHLKVYFWLFLSLVVGYACSKNEVASQAESVRFVRPANFPVTVYNFDENKLTKDGFELGKKLFYDARLSADKSVSCGSCHQQFAAFAQLDHPVSHGVNNCLGKRNAPVLFNLAWQKEFFWDGGAKNLEIVPINAITDPCEMGTSLTSIVEFLNKTAPYPKLFNTAFNSSNITSQQVLKALTQFMVSMVSATSKYDKVMRDPQKHTFTPEEQQGYMLFKEKCSNCHTEPLFTDLSYRNNGLDLKSADLGRKIITEQASDEAKFKVPTLRNIERSPPYMHDGRFNTLDKVLAHYTIGIVNHPNLDASLKAGIQLSSLQKQYLISFLKTLTDEEFIKNKAFSEY